MDTAMRRTHRNEDMHKIRLELVGRFADDPSARQHVDWRDETREIR